MKLYNGYKRLNENYALLTDSYEYSMSNTYLQSHKENQEVVFDVFFRKIPNNGGYVVMAGLDKIIEYIETLHYGERELDYFRRNNYNEEFINYLKNFKFTGDIYAIPDGTPVFPNEPILTVKAPLNQAQIIETAILSMLNGATEHATGARRIIEAVPEGVPVMEFGARRADGLEAANDSSIYGIMAGCVGTSNTMAADMLDMTAIGTMAHSYIESFDTELEAFITYAKFNQYNCTLLVDTYDTLKSGIPNAIKTFEYMRDNGLDINHIGIRIDSGDLAYLSKQARKMFKEAGFPQTKICLSNGLTAETIETLISQGAEFDSLGVGDNISKPEGRMGCVYKEVALDVDGKLVPKIKVSNDAIKVLNPCFKKLYRAYDKDTGYAIADIITEHDKQVSADNLVIISPFDYLNSKEISNFDLVPLQQTIFKDGKLVYNDPDIREKIVYCDNQMKTLYPEVRRTKMPHEYPVSATEEYIETKKQLILKTKERISK